MNRTVNMMLERQNNYQMNMNKRRLWMIGIALLFLLLLFSLYFFSKTVTAQRYEERVKLVTSIEVKKGDTLWSIAERYITDEYDNLHEYIDEIMSSNGLASDTIHVGSHIIVPYYVNASN
jgi:hypothetical protein